MSWNSAELNWAHPLQCNCSLVLEVKAWASSNVSTGTTHSRWCKGPGGVRHRSVPGSRSRTSGHFKMFGCLFTGTLVLSCIDPSPSDRPAHWTFWRELFHVSTLLTRILKLTLRALSQTGTTGPPAKPPQKTGKCAQGSSGLSFQRWTVNRAHTAENSVSAGSLCIIPWGSFKAHAVIITPYFLIMSANTEKIGSNLLAYFQELPVKSWL